MSALFLYLINKMMIYALNKIFSMTLLMKLRVVHDEIPYQHIFSLKTILLTIDDRRTEHAGVSE